MSEIKVNKVTPRSGTTVTLGEAGDTIALGACASQTGFGRSGSVNWCTTVKTAGFTAENGKGYLVNTTSTAFTMTLPCSPSDGDIVAVKDLYRTAGTNALTIGRAGSKMDGDCTCGSLTSDGISATLLYSGATKGWTLTNDDTTSTMGATFMVATGGTPSTGTICGDYKTHTFTGTGPFNVSCAGNAAGNNKVDFLVIAGGGAGGAVAYGGGGGAGGYRESKQPGAPWTASPIAACGGALTISATDYTITVGGGGAVQPTIGGNGCSSVFSTITSTGGGGGSGNGAPDVGASGGSGGGGGGQPGCTNIGGAGNTPATPVSQGNNGGAGNPGTNPGTGGLAGAGGGASAVGSSIAPGHGCATPGAPGGAGHSSSISGTSVQRSGGGGGGGNVSSSGGTGGGGGGGQGGPSSAAGTPNTGGGGGGGSHPAGSPNGASAGGSGIVVLRYKFQ
jgi:hypothetical protein